jgi:hypothetical protein
MYASLLVDGESLSGLMAPLGLGWKARTHPGRTGAGGRTDAAAAQAGAVARDFEVECV